MVRRGEMRLPAAIVAALPGTMVPARLSSERDAKGRRNRTALMDYFNQPRFRKYQNGVIALATINTSANG